MLRVRLPGGLRVLALGAHCDDVEIGAGGTLLRLAAESTPASVDVLVLSSDEQRKAEAGRSAEAFLAGVGEVRTTVHGFPDGRLPQHWGDVKDVLQQAARDHEVDLVLAPSPDDAHQDHRLLGEMATTVWRDHLVLNYELPKWDGDLGRGRPTHYVPLSPETMDRKVALLAKHFPSQAGHDWFGDETFRALGRLRGMESRSPYAEAFSVAKVVLDLSR